MLVTLKVRAVGLNQHRRVDTVRETVHHTHFYTQWQTFHFKTFAWSNYNKLDYMLLYVAGVYYFRIISKISPDTTWYLLLRMIIIEGGKKSKTQDYYHDLTFFSACAVFVLRKCRSDAQETVNSPSVWPWLPAFSGCRDYQGLRSTLWRGRDLLPVHTWVVTELNSSDIFLKATQLTKWLENSRTYRF